LKAAIKNFLRGPAGSWLISLYLRFVNLTSRHVHVDGGHDFNTEKPVIYATWHGQNFIFAFRFAAGNYPTLLVAHHGDGRLIGQAMHNLGVPLVFGSGSTEAGRNKGGARAFLKLLKTLRHGQSVTLTADVPKVAREVGEGIVLMARKSGAPIVPVAMTTSRRKILKTWDRMQFNLPFSRMVFVSGAPILIPDDNSPLAPYQQMLSEALEAAQSHAFALAAEKSIREE